MKLRHIGFFILALPAASVLASTTITIAAVGDVLLHTQLQKTAAEERSFSYLWKPVEKYINAADISYANFEGPAAINVPVTGPGLENPSLVWDMDCYKKEFKNGVKDPEKFYIWTDGCYYSSYPRFNYHPDLIEDLKSSGFDIVSTANNHALDRKSLGIDQTIQMLDFYQLDFTGTRKRMENIRERSWEKITKVKGIELVWISCTYGTNGMRDELGQVLHCFEDKDSATILNLITEHVDAGRVVVMLPHWGEEYNAKFSLERNTKPGATEKRFAQKWLEAGAKLIIGNHPHAFKQFEKNVGGKTNFIAYSLGNFVSNQGQAAQRASGVLFLKLHFEGLQLVDIEPKLLPAFMANRASIGENTQLQIMPLDSQRPEMQYLSAAVGYDDLISENDLKDWLPNLFNLQF